MTSWLRPSKISPSACLPLAPSNVYSFSTASQGSSRRSALSWSRRRLNSFSFARCFFRAATHASWLTTLWVVIWILLVDHVGSGPRADGRRCPRLGSGDDEHTHHPGSRVLAGRVGVGRGRRRA